MELQEATTPDPGSNRRGRPRSFEQARRGLIQAETIKSYASLIPTLMESGLYGLVFVNLYRFFRSNPINVSLSTIEEAVKQASGVETGAAVIGLMTGNPSFHIAYLANKSETIRNQSARKKNHDDIQKLQLLIDILVPLGYKGRVDIVGDRAGVTKDIKAFLDTLPVATRGLPLVQWQAAMAAYDAKKDYPPSVTQMDWLEAAGWAAFVVILIKGGLTLGGQLGQKALG